MLRGIRVYELAKELRVSSKDILQLLASEMNIDKNNHMAMLNDQVVAKIRRLIAEQQGERTAKGRTSAEVPEAQKPASPSAPSREPGPAVPATGPQPAGPSRPVGGAPVAVRPQAPRGPVGPQRSGPPSGPVHFRPAPGLLPLVTTHPTPTRPRRPVVAPRPEPAAPEAVRPTAVPPPAPPMTVEPPRAGAPAPEPQAEVPVPVVPVVSVAPVAPVAPEAVPEAEVAPPSAPSQPEEPSQEEPEPAREPAADVAHAPEVQMQEAEVPAPAPAQQAPARQAPAPSAPTPRPEVGSEVAVRQGLLPVRKIVPGAPPSLRDPSRPLLPIRKAEPRPAASTAAPASTAPAAGGATGDAAARGRRGPERRRPGAEGTVDPRHKGGAGRRPARPGGVRFGESEISAEGRRRGSAARRRRRVLLAHRAEAATPPDFLKLSGPILVGDLAELLHVAPAEVISKLLTKGIMAAINQQLELEQASEICTEFGVAVETPEVEATPPSSVDRETLGRLLAHDNPERRAERPPIVAVLGHVDHGKTTLLDAIRSTRVAAGEAGGITQHIGAYVVQHGARQITFLDTPGHEAFTAMRARGAQVTDIAVVVVAADDGVMPQTLEAISHARAAGVPIVVALNKVDKANANPDRVLQQLTEHGLQPEAWGGDTIVVPVSALRKEGIPELLEMLLLVADVQELHADPDRAAVGTVIEAEVTRGRGPVATVLIQSGTMRVGDTFVAGQVFGRVRAMMDDLGRTVKTAGPSMPVVVLGFEQVPMAGDPLQVLAEREARTLATQRQEQVRQQSLASERAMSLAEMAQEREGERPEDLRIILKADVQGSVEAARGSLERLHNDEVRVVLLHAGVGPVSESDVMLASASGAVILGFNVRPDANAERAAQQAAVEIRTYRIIYEMLDEVQQALEGRLKPKTETVTVGHVEVRRPIRVPGAGVIAGAHVTDGLVRRGLACRVLRDGTIVHEGTVASLRRFKDDVREVQAGFECGLGFDRWNDVKEGDVVEVLEERVLAR